jgi:hypothetical protein
MKNKELNSFLKISENFKKFVLEYRLWEYLSKDYILTNQDKMDAVNFFWEKIRDKYVKSEYLVLIDDGQNNSNLFFGGNKEESENEINKKIGNMLFLNKGGCAVYDIKNDKETRCVGCVTKKVIIK